MSLTRGCVLDVANQLGGAMPGVVTLHDFSRFKNDGVMTNVTWAQLGSTGKWVMVFNGTSSYLNFGSDESLSLTNATIEWWLYRANRDNHMYLFNRVGDTNDPRIYWTQASDIVNLSAVSGGTVYVDSVASITAVQQVWYHIVISGMDITNVVGNLYFGAQQALGATNYYEGYLGCYRIYNYALTPAQIRARYHSTRWLFGV